MNSVTIMFKEFGIRLSFTPTVLGGDLINLKVKPEVSSLDFANAVVVSGFRMPALTTRRTETEVELRDGQTFAIAGLLANTVQDSMRKIPGIGDIPILGWLFKSRAMQKAQTELVVMITPTIIRRGQRGVSEGLPSLVEPFLGAARQDAPESRRLHRLAPLSGDAAEAAGPATRCREGAAPAAPAAVPAPAVQPLTPRRPAASAPVPSRPSAVPPAAPAAAAEPPLPAASGAAPSAPLTREQLKADRGSGAKRSARAAAGGGEGSGSRRRSVTPSSRGWQRRSREARRPGRGEASGGAGQEGRRGPPPCREAREGARQGSAEEGPREARDRGPRERRPRTPAARRRNRSSARRRCPRPPRA